MKKLVLFFAALLSAGALFAQTDCSDIFMSEYVEGWNNNKALELYNPTGSPITLDGKYQLIRFSNGSTSSNTETAYVLPLTGTIEPYKVMVIIQDTIPAGQDTMVWPGLRKKGTWLAPYAYATQPPYTPGGNCVFWNGDDAVSLQKKTGSTWNHIDIFGEIGVRPSNWQGTYNPSGAWTDTKPYIKGVGIYLTKSKTLKRKHGVKHGVDFATMMTYGETNTGGIPDSFNALLEYDTLPVNFFDSLGQHWCDCKNSSAVGKLTPGNQNISILPNPVTNSQFTVVASQPVSSVEVVSIVGQSVYSQDYSSRQRDVKVLMNILPEGVYLVKVKLSDNQLVIKKIIIQ